jgi:hypothetical protein
MKKKYSILAFTMVFNFLTLFSQDVSLQEFKSEYFEFSYPKTWKLDTTENKYSFYYNPNLGDITISFFETRGLSEKDLKKMILELNEKKEAKPDIKINTSGGTMTCIYKYDFDKVKYYIKAIQINNRVYLISLNWNENAWENFKDVLLNAFNSFKPK